MYVSKSINKIINVCETNGKYGVHKAHFAMYVYVYKKRMRYSIGEQMISVVLPRDTPKTLVFP